MHSHNPTSRRKPIVGVMGSGTSPHREHAEPLGRWLAEAGYHLLTGGGSGVMECVSRAFSETARREGLVLGVLRADSAEHPAGQRAGYPNQWVELAIRTHLPLSGERGKEIGSRNHINVLTSDVIVVLPGGAGTASEIELAIEYGRPIVAWTCGTIDDRLAALSDVPRAENLDEVKRFVRQALER